MSACVKMALKHLVNVNQLSRPFTPEWNFPKCFFWRKQFFGNVLQIKKRDLWLGTCLFCRDSVDRCTLLSGNKPSRLVRIPSVWSYRTAKQVTTWRSTALLRSICLCSCSAKQIAFWTLISITEQVDKHPLQPSSGVELLEKLLKKLFPLCPMFVVVFFCFFLIPLMLVRTKTRLTEWFHQTWSLF